MAKQMDLFGNEMQLNQEKKKEKSIISASRRTDIPAFFGEWFTNRLKEGYFHSINPFNPGSIKRVSLLREAVDAFVFWSKNPEPFIKHLDYLDSRGYNYYFQYTLNDYPSVFEPKVPDIAERVNTFIKLSKRIDRGRVIWRYDPIVVSSQTPVEYHLQKIEGLAKKLEGYVERLTISFVDYYGKVEGRFKKLKVEKKISFHDITLNEESNLLVELCSNIKKIGDSYGIQVYSCAETVDIKNTGILPGSCVDGKLLEKLFNIDQPLRKDPNQRKECLCVKSVDMGFYNTCRFNCAYCYANHSEVSVDRKLKNHRVCGESLIL